MQARLGGYGHAVTELISKQSKQSEKPTLVSDQHLQQRVGDKRSCRWRSGKKCRSKQANRKTKEARRRRLWLGSALSPLWDFEFHSRSADLHACVSSLCSRLTLLPRRSFVYGASNSAWLQIQKLPVELLASLERVVTTLLCRDLPYLSILSEKCAEPMRDCAAD